MANRDGVKLTKAQQVIYTAIAGNLGFRMALAIVNPASYETNRNELAEILAKDIADRLAGAGLLASTSQGK